MKLLFFDGRKNEWANADFHGDLPGQEVPTQSRSWIDSPEQFRPLFAGDGLEHSLRRTWVPLPHELEQEFHSDQGV